jgi:hypothetical protein
MDFLYDRRSDRKWTTGTKCCKDSRLTNENPQGRSKEHISHNKKKKNDDGSNTHGQKHDTS